MSSSHQPQQQQACRGRGVAQLLAGTAPQPTDDLLEPLLPPSTHQHDQQPANGKAPLPPSAAAEFDPFPATTAARAAAAEVAARRSAAPQPVDNLRAAVLGRSASAAAAAVAGRAAEADRFQRQLAFASGLSWAVNILLLVAKFYAYWLSQSKAVLASAADSAVDLVSEKRAA